MPFTLLPKLQPEKRLRLFYPCRGRGGENGERGGGVSEKRRREKDVRCQFNRKIKPPDTGAPDIKVPVVRWYSFVIDHRTYYTGMSGESAGS